MTEDEYQKALRRLGIHPAGGWTDIAQEWEDDAGNTYWVSNGLTLSPEDRKEAVEWFTRFFRRPFGGGGVH